MGGGQPRSYSRHPGSWRDTDSRQWPHTLYLTVIYSEARKRITAQCRNGNETRHYSSVFIASTYRAHCDERNISKTQHSRVTITPCRAHILDILTYGIQTHAVQTFDICGGVLVEHIRGFLTELEACCTLRLASRPSINLTYTFH